MIMLHISWNRIYHRSAAERPTIANIVSSSGIVDPLWRILKMNLLPCLLFWPFPRQEDHNYEKQLPLMPPFLLLSFHFLLKYTVHQCLSHPFTLFLFCILYSLCAASNFPLICSLPQKFWMTSCTVRLCVWMPSKPGATTMMSTVCMATLWSWLLRSEYTSSVTYIIFKIKWCRSRSYWPMALNMSLMIIYVHKPRKARWYENLVGAGKQLKSDLYRLPEIHENS